MPYKDPAKQKLWYQRNRAKIIAKQKRYYATPVGRRSRRAITKRWRDKNPDKIRAQGLKNKYNITPMLYQQMFDEQNGICPICERPLDPTLKDWKMRVCVDHCHDNKTVRGLLHSICNLMLGYANDSPESLRRAALYLERNK